ncbi:MAG: hypothetical protein AAF787_02160, partial [Chloroflexota bacterium]
MSFRAAIAIGCLFITFLNTSPTVSAQGIPPCGWERETTVDVPWAGDGNLWCVERVVEDISFGAVGFYHLTAADDGSLYATLPALNSVAHITDTDGDLLPDTPTIVLSDLTRPVGIDWQDGTLYIAGNEHLYRYNVADNELTTLADNIPWGWTGYPTAGVTVHDDRIYVAAGGDAACTPGRGAVYSYALDGSDRETVATGLMAPADVAHMHGALWVADAATERVLELLPGADYGACSGADSPDVAAYTFAAGSRPVALAAYGAGTFPQMENRLLVALHGDISNVIVEGYDVVALAFDGGAPANHSNVLPVVPQYPAITEQKLH